MNDTKIEYCECPDFGFYLIANRVICIRCNRWKPPGYEPNPHLYKQPPKDSVSQSKKGEDDRQKLIDFFIWFRNHGELLIGRSVESMIDEYFKTIKL